MKFHLLAVRDSAANVFNMPYATPNLGVAIRQFTDEVNRPDENNTLYKHPEDFELFQVGEYDDDTASIVSMQPRSLVRAVDVRKG